MRRLLEAWSRVVAVLRRRDRDRDFDDELQSHLELLAEQYERRGMPPAEARRQAILRIGGLRPTRDLHREARGLSSGRRRAAS